ncbi:MAG: amino acid decarboxylase, partial [Clostridia bacterium]|nr:amino acid decarboxylase [Clostridia bacterium]
MKTPIYDFLRGYKKSGVSRFHMPGHKGVGGLCASLDITEVNGADVLYHADGIIAESEANATELFNTGHTFYSTEGSTLAIKAMLGILKREDGNGTILAARNVHKAFVYAVGELDLSVRWLYPKEATHLCECNITAADVKEALSGMEVLPMAVYVTSPDYLGNLLDIRGISAVCDEYGIPLLVDNAHGAYLAFDGSGLHPIQLGAAMCADSAHKTLPVLTGGAYLHISKKHPEYTVAARDTLSIFASTSPSYLTMASLDLCNMAIAEELPAKLAKCKQKVTNIKALLKELGQSENTDEGIKIRIDAHRFGYTGTDYSDILRKNKVECEYADDRFVVLMASAGNTARDFRRLETVIRKIARENRSPITDGGPTFTTAPVAKMTVREALFSPYETVETAAAIGRV